MALNEDSDQHAGWCLVTVLCLLWMPAVGSERVIRPPKTQGGT